MAPAVSPARRRASSLRLTPESCVAYLLNLGLLDRHTLVEQEVQVQDVFGRNHNLRVTIAGGSGYFIKQAPPEDRALDSPLAVEAAVYRSGLLPFLPRLIHFDPEAFVLVLELLPARGEATVSGESYRGAATMLAAAHRIDRSAHGGSLPLAAAAPWVFDMARPSPASLRELAPAQLALFESLQSSARLLEALDRMRERWEPEALIHGDFKWSNLAAGKLLDWELAQWGDPAWDVGGAMHGVVVEDLLALELPGDGGPERLFEMLGAMLSRRRDDHRAFWSAYLTERGLPAGSAASLQERVPAATGLRLIKTAYEWCQAETRIPRRAAAILQLGINMVTRPDEALRFVLGLA